MFSYILIYSHIFSFILTCSHIFSYIVIYSHILSQENRCVGGVYENIWQHAVEYRLLSLVLFRRCFSYILIYCHILSYIVIYSHRRIGV